MNPIRNHTVPYRLALLAALLLAAFAPALAETDAPRAPVARPADPEMHPEGQELSDVVGRIENLKLDLREGEAMRSVFRPVDGKGYFVLLENSLLERLERLTSQGELLVKVSGVVTEYNGINYLLLRRAAVKRTD